MRPAIIAVLAACGCAWQSAVPPASMAISDLLAQSRASAAKVTCFTADMEVTTLGPQGRRHGQVTIAAKRPGSLAYQIAGPHGGLIEAFATDGMEMQLYHGDTGEFLYGPATAANLDQFLGRIPLHFSSQRWVGLFFGEVDIPATAIAHWDADTHRVVVEWPEQAWLNRIELDPRTLQVLRGQVLAAGRAISEVRVERRDSKGLPRLLHLEVPEEHLAVVALIKGIAYDPPISSDVFVLSPPPAAHLVHLE
jgi:hypothetical protein